MTPFLIKTLLSALIIAGVSELARRSTLLGGLLASLPLTSILAFIWLYRDTHDTAAVASLSTSILWLVLPSLVLFVALPIALRRGVPFYASLTLAAMATIAAYGLTVFLLKRAGISL